MKPHRRALVMAAVTMMLAGTTVSTTFAQAPEIVEVQQAGETLSKLMIAPDRAALGRLFADELSYRHSDGRVQNKAEFIDALVKGKSMFKSIALFDQTISLVGDIAIVRHRFEADAISNGVPAQPRIRILQVWQKQENAWRLLVRQAH
jgi:Domain of unknown function (DUF4440)